MKARHRNAGISFCPLHWLTELRADLVLQPLWQWLSYSCSLSRRDRYVCETELLWNFTAKEIYVPLFKSPALTWSMKSAEHERYHLTSPDGCHWLLWLDSFVVFLILFSCLLFMSDIKCLSLSWWRLVHCGSTRDIRCIIIRKQILIGCIYKYSGRLWKAWKGFFFPPSSHVLKRN